MTSQSKAADPVAQDLTKRDLAEYGVARFRDQVFDAVVKLWRRRKADGWTQKQVADLIGRDPGWVSRNLRAPGNWTLRTVGELVQALHGEAEVGVVALEDSSPTRQNFDAYEGYVPRAPGDWDSGSSSVGTFIIGSPRIVDALVINETVPVSGGLFR